jgi:hypothetical protein
MIATLVSAWAVCMVSVEGLDGRAEAGRGAIMAKRIAPKTKFLVLGFVILVAPVSLTPF